MQKIIVTADDYGMCNEVDKAIDEGIKNGIITTTNVMLNMDTFENAKTLRERFPNLTVGIHFNVTTGKPLSNPKDIKTLVDSNGNFYAIDVFRKKFSKGLISAKDLEIELKAQCDLFEKYLGKADYWNTHENSSLNTKTFKVFSKVAKEYGIKATRNFQRVYYDKKNIGVKRALREFLVKNFFNVWFSLIKKDFKMPRARIVGFGKQSKTEGNVLLNAIKKDGRNYLEIVVHPATNGDNPYFGNISTERVNEYNFVSSKEVYNKYHENGIEFVGFEQL